LLWVTQWASHPKMTAKMTDFAWAGVVQLRLVHELARDARLVEATESGYSAELIAHSARLPILKLLRM
jgi:hypothetical protein